MPKVINVTEEELMGIAKNLIDNKEYDKITCRYISSQAGIGVGTFYHFFNSKLELIAKIMLKDWILALEEIDYSTLLIESIRSIYNSIYNFSRKYYDLWQYEKKSSNKVFAGKHDLLVKQVKNRLIKAYDSSYLEYDEKIIDFLAAAIIYYASSLKEYDDLNNIFIKLIK